MCIDKSATRIHINSQADGNSALFAIDAEVLSTEDIIRVSESMEECTVFFENTCKKHGVSALVIKDNKGVQSSCVAKIQCPRDLQIFGQVHIYAKIPLVLASQSAIFSSNNIYDETCCRH